MRKGLNERVGRKLLYAFLAIICVAIVAYPSLAVNANPGDDDENSPWLPEDETLYSTTYETLDETGGYIPYPVVDNTTPMLQSMPEELGAGSIPGSYDARKQGQMTSVKNQYNTQNCWSFAALACMEAGLKGRGIMSNPDFSELHFVRYTMSNIGDPLGGLNADSTVFYGSDRMQTPGNIAVAYNVLTAWKGAVNESRAVFPTNSRDTSFTPSIDDAFKHDTAHLQAVFRINIDDMEGIKRAIMNYGGVSSGFCWSKNFYKESTNAYFTGVDKYYAGNHAVAIVGWNDNFSRYNFPTDPGRNGAWLIKNSWGPEFGDSGYFWISYAENSLSSTAFVLVADPATNYDYCYQYDGSPLSRVRTTRNNSITLANMFTVSGGSETEEVKAVSFDIQSANVSYEIQIYGNIKDSGNPVSGTPLLEKPVTGTTGYSGYYTVSIPSGAKVKKGTRYSVVITFRSSSSMQFLMETSGVFANTQYLAGAYADQSFDYYPATGKWNDYGSNYGENLRIKAFTKNATVYPKSISLNYTDVQLLVGNSLNLTANLLPAETTEKKITWSVDRPDLAQVSNGKVNVWAGGLITVTAKTVNGLTAKCVIRATVDKDPSNPFADVKTGGWEFSAAQFVYSKGYMNGKGELIPGKIIFDPNGTITRSQFVQTLYNMAGRPKVTYVAKFSDVPSGKWYSLPISWASKNDIVAGKGDVFDIDGKATREQLASMFYKYAKYKGYDVSIKSGSGKSYDSFSDKNKVSSWAVTPMKWALSRGIMSGTGSGLLDPQGAATRVQCAVMVRNFMNAYPGSKFMVDGVEIDIDEIDAVEADDVDVQSVEEVIEEEVIDEEVVDEEVVDEEVVDEEVVDEEEVDEEIVEEEVVDKEVVDEKIVDKEVVDEEVVDKEVVDEK